MSGPKVSVYDLTAKQRAIIAEELQRRMRELEKRQELLTELHAYVSEADQLSKAIAKFNMIAQEETIHLDSSTLSMRISDVTASIQSLMKLISESEQLEDNEKLSVSTATISNRIKYIRTTVLEISNQAASIAEKLQGVLSSNISELFAHEEQINSEANSDIIRDVQLSLQSYATHKYLPDSLRQKINRLLERLPLIPTSSFSNFRAVEVQPVAKSCEDFLELWDAYGSQYELLLQRYELLAKETGREEVAVVPFSKHAIEEISRLIAIEEIEYQRQSEEAYIEDSISSVMKEMGYDIRGQRNVTRRNGSHYSSSLFQYRQDSAVNVIFSDDGRITMEVGKMDHCDRIPESNESKSMVKTMEAFCTDFVEIEKRLAAKGVILKDRIRLSPPAADFAQVINVDDFSAISNRQTSTRNYNVAKKSKRQTLDN